MHWHIFKFLDFLKTHKIDKNDNSVAKLVQCINIHTTKQIKLI